MVRSVCRAGCSLAILFLASCGSVSLHPHRDGSSVECAECESGCKSGICDRNPTVMALAKEIDHLEHHVDHFGTVVAKTPAIWGEARLTKHRREFEEEMAKEVSQFNDTLQGFIARSDQAFLAQAMSLQAAISGDAAYKNTVDSAGKPTKTEISPSSANINVQNMLPSLGTTATTSTPGTPTTVTPDKTATQVFQSAPFTLPGGTGFLKATGTVQLEPTVHLDQKARFLNHLQELRRINEGDDTAHSPGYALYLVRMPISVLPGKKTRTGHGAEITITVDPQFGDELLPKTFRPLVIGDVIDLLGVPISYLADPAYRELTRPTKSGGSICADVWSGVKQLVVSSDPPKSTKQVQKIRDQAHKLYQMVKSNVSDAPLDYSKLNDKQRESLQQTLSKKWNNLPSSLQRRSRHVLAPSQIYEVLGKEYIEELVKAVETQDKYADFEVSQVPDVHKILAVELESAYDSLAHPSFAEWWTSPAMNNLAAAIRENNLGKILEAREGYYKTLVDRVRGNSAPITKVGEALGWAIAVESALLNDRLKEDIRDIVAAKGAGNHSADGVQFFGPDPSAQARLIFGEYVRLRWPVHVFALDPVSQEENLGDVFSRRRETQLALSLAFASGNISASSFTRYVRRLETDMSTIALHRTAVGFSHGENTFGWRFYPRFQTPNFESNLTTIFRDQLWGGPSKDAEIAQHQIEPGMRECVALVIMPSFVANAKFETRSNWFHLTHPKHTQPRLTETMRLSESIKRMENCVCKIKDADCYRDGEVTRLLSRVRQLSRELPLQTLVQQVPVENSLGGFAMLSSGQTELAPQLVGFYGEPGVCLGRESVVYLVGDNFSEHETQTIAGNRLCQTKMLSRRVLQVTIPGSVQTWKDIHDKLNVDVHVATPYGVSGHTSIPVESNSDSAGFRLVGALTQTVGYKVKDADVQVNSLPAATDIAIEAPAGMPFPAAAKVVMRFAIGKRSLGSTDPIDLTYDVARNSFMLTGKNFDALNTALGAAAKALLKENSPPQDSTITITAVYMGANSTQNPIDGAIIIQLKKDAP